MKSTVIITGDDERIYHNSFMDKFVSNMNGWLASSSAGARAKMPSPKYLGIGVGTTDGKKDALEHECLRVPITAKFVEPVSARTRYIVNLQVGDMSSISWGEVGLFDSEDFSLTLNRCDVLGKWTSADAIKLYISADNVVQDSGSLFGEYDILSSSATLFSTIDLADGANNKISNATNISVVPYFPSYVSFDGVTTYTRTTGNPLLIGKDSNATSGLIYRSGVQFNLTTLPADAVITSVKFGATTKLIGTGGSAVSLYPYHGNVQNTPNTDTAQNEYTNIISGTPYVTATNTFTSLQKNEIDLGATALTDIKTSFAASKVFSLGIAADSDNSYTVLEDPYLYITYTRTTALGVNAQKFGVNGDSVQFYLFLSDSTVFTNDSIYIVLSSSETASTDQWKWTLKPSALNSGWNAIQVTLGESTITGSPSTSYIKRFSITVDGTSTPIIAGIDNIRLFRNHGLLTNRVVITDAFAKSVGTSATIQWVIDVGSGI